MTIVEWIPIFSALLVLVGGALIFRWHRAIERESEMLLERRGLYAAYIRARYELRASLRSDDAKEWAKPYTNYKIKRDALLVYSPDQIASCIEVHSNRICEFAIEHRNKKMNLNELEGLSNEEIDLFVKTLTAMRLDTFTHTKYHPSIDKAATGLWGKEI